MKRLYFPALILGFTACNTGKTSTALKADAETGPRIIETVVTCEQDDGDHWTSVGIGINDGPGFIAYVVDYNDDDNSHKLALKKQVSEKTRGGVTTYTDPMDTFKLTVSKVPNSDRLKGSLSILAEGTGGVSLSDLECVEKSSIEFATQAGSKKNTYTCTNKSKEPFFSDSYVVDISGLNVVLRDAGARKKYRLNHDSSYRPTAANKNLKRFFVKGGRDIVEIGDRHSEEILIPDELLRGERSGFIKLRALGLDEESAVGLQTDFFSCVLQ